MIMFQGRIEIAYTTGPISPAVCSIQLAVTSLLQLTDPPQAASGAGAAAMEELRQQTRDVLDGKPAQPKIFPLQVRVGAVDGGAQCGQQCVARTVAHCVRSWAPDRPGVVHGWRLNWFTLHST